ncbi:three component ABC system middle component [Stenotrophomonas maltophilia]|uniref:three component ABC system middle component n=1 Tax=Stenotrophomonas maltophilia TaxID=40324 RepID=UPI002ACD1392|nr:three component ABC system middle component [Stenotrophomonas maltophilia]MDZ5790595.1 three component ABC system middle component [Stenotrophomonas maltophilia]
MTMHCESELLEPIWRRQPPEQIRLLNPAFLGTLIYSAAKGYEEESDGSGLPYALAFVALPVVLQKVTRENLPRSISTSLAAWLSVHPSALVGFSDRAKSIAPLVRQSVAVAASSGMISLDGHRLVPELNVRKINKYGREVATPEVADCIKKAHFSGRWFAAAGDYSTVMALWGVRP